MSLTYVKDHFYASVHNEAKCGTFVSTQFFVTGY